MYYKQRYSISQNALTNQNHYQLPAQWAGSIASPMHAAKMAQNLKIYAMESSGLTSNKLCSPLGQVKTINILETPTRRNFHRCNQQPNS
jgi:hypothetical protein